MSVTTIDDPTLAGPNDHVLTAPTASGVTTAPAGPKSPPDDSAPPPPPPDFPGRGGRGGGGPKVPYRKLTVNLLPNVSDDLTTVEDETGHTPTEVVNRSIGIYRWALGLFHSDGAVLNAIIRYAWALKELGDDTSITKAVRVYRWLRKTLDEGGHVIVMDSNGEPKAFRDHHFI
jgi:hypothetical protein